MADNVVANAGAGGATFATDQRAADSVHFPLTKLVWGALDTFNVVDSSTNALPIQDGGNSITVDGTVAATQSGSWSIVQATASSLNATVVGTGTFAVQAAQSGAWTVSGTGTAGSAATGVLTVQGIASMTPLLATLSGTNNIATVSTVTSLTQFNGNAIDTNSGTKSAGTLRVVLATDQPALTNKLLVTPDAGSTVQQVPGTTGGLSYSVANPSAASNNKTQAKGSAGQVYFISIQNISSAPVYLKMFDKTSASVTAGTTACDYQFMCPANSTAANGAGVVFSFDNGIAHANGITWMLTTGISATDNTSTSANVAIVTIGYK